jgi:hypothetical protein
LNETTRLLCEGADVSYRSDWCEASFRVNGEEPVQLAVHAEASPWFASVLENLLRVLVAYDVLGRGGVMLHCNAIVRDDWAVVMFGHSGAGKSTTSELALASGCSVISDDINVIERIEGSWKVRPIPFSGTLESNSDIRHPVPLLGMFRLRQAGSDYVQPCSAARAVSLLAGSAPFINRDVQRYARLVDVLSTLAADVGVNDLYFTRSGKFLQHVFPSRPS